MIEVRAKNNSYSKGKRYIDLAGDQVFYPVVDGKVLAYLAETPDVAYLVGLGYKYDGANSQFAHMAVRMLGIDSVYA